LFLFPPNFVSLPEKYESVLPNYAEFSTVQEESKRKEGRDGRIIYCFYYALPILILWRIDSSMKDQIPLLETLCTHFLENINEQINICDEQKAKDIFQELKNKKEEIFNYYKNKSRFFLYKASLYFFSPKNRP